MTISSRKENGIVNVAIEICKISPLDIPNRIITRGKILCNNVYNTLKLFCQTNE